jgi:hypothetical protein
MALIFFYWYKKAEFYTDFVSYNQKSYRSKKIPDPHQSDDDSQLKHLLILFRLILYVGGYTMAELAAFRWLQTLTGGHQNVFLRKIIILLFALRQKEIV